MASPIRQDKLDCKRFNHEIFRALQKALRLHLTSHSVGMRKISSCTSRLLIRFLMKIVTSISTMYKTRSKKRSRTKFTFIVSYWHIHSKRDTWSLSQLLDKMRNLKIVKNLLKDSSPSTTLRIKLCQRDFQLRELISSIRKWCFCLLEFILEKFSPPLFLTAL